MRYTVSTSGQALRHSHQDMDEASKSENFSSQTDAEKVSVDDPPSQKSTCLKALCDGHSTVQVNLQLALLELAEKEAKTKQLEEDVLERREKAYLREERIRLLTEKLCCLTTALERKEKKQEMVFKEQADTMWKLQECKQFLEKLQGSYTQMRIAKEQRQQDMTVLDGQKESILSNRNELQDDIIRLTNYKLQLQSGDASACAILNGEKIMELEQRKCALRDAMEERSLRPELMCVEIDEREERVNRLRESLEKTKEQHQSILLDRKNHLGYLAETELRLQRSLDYLRAKIDYGMCVPTPPPWPNNIRNSLYKGGQK